MNLFESQLLRLKECLGATQDQEVAEALGMTKAAFSYRKRSGSFPEEKLIELKSKLPELDVQYILFGERWCPEHQAQHLQFSESAIELGLKPLDVARAIASGLAEVKLQRYAALNHPLVASLIESLHWCDDDAIELLVRVAGRFRGDKRLPLGDRFPVASPDDDKPVEHADPPQRRRR